MLILYTLQRGRLPTTGLELPLPGSSRECERKSKSSGGSSGRRCQSLSLKRLPCPDRPGSKKSIFMYVFGMIWMRRASTTTNVCLCFKISVRPSHLYADNPSSYSRISRQGKIDRWTYLSNNQSSVTLLFHTM